MQRTRRGFTLIELLIVVVIIGILAAIALPKFSETKRKAFITAMRSDLKNLVPSAELHFADNSSYAGWVLPAGSNGVTLAAAPAGGAASWGATAVHAGAAPTICTVTVGVIGRRDGDVTCAP